MNLETYFFIITALVEQESDLTHVDVSFAMASLSSEEIEGLPPGGGIESK